MDSVTQIALGAALGEAVLGKQIGRRGLLWGGVLGLFPDLDILIPFGDAVKNFTYHRGFSHSMFVLTALTPLFVWIALRLHPQTIQYRRRWSALVFLALMTHILLDCLTVYGTQIFWPLPTPPVMWSSIFIIDPLYSLPLIGGVLAALLLRRTSLKGHTVNAICLVISTLYLAWSVGAKLHVNHIVTQSLERKAIAYERFLTVPAPFNTVLWRVLVMVDDGYYEGFYSLLDKTGDIPFTHYPSNGKLLERLEEHWPVQRLQWFTHGFYSVKELDGAIVLSDLRMGLEPDYFFQFKVGEIGNPHPVPTQSARIRADRRLDRLAWVWKRIWDPGVLIP
ncbi:metal-dependent hydrolase [Desulfatitalea tepidiphila]|uniref:metal-dependent hydrolase n=1 Tax=Desulfatitalea tepidiphila TaxID=1185843 RepID=UPI0006B4C816|nr:metal-dependent hydrolase [Desulfatitalea tepidiphila]